MSNRFRWLPAALLVALAASLFWGGEQRRELGRERREMLADRQALLELESRVAAAENGRSTAEARLQGQIESDIRRMFPESRAVPASATIDKFNAAADRDPVWGPFYRKLERRRILSRYNVLLSTLKIPREKLALLQDLLVERALTRRNVVHQLREAGRKFNSPEVLAAVDHATDEVDAKIEGLIGRDLARKLKEWNSAVYSYGNAPNGPVAQDAVTLHEAGFELSTEQLVELALIRYEVYVLNTAARSGSGSDQVDRKTGLTRLEEQLLARQAEVLSPPEIAVLRNWAIEEHRARAAVNAIRAKFHIQADRAAP